MKRRSDLIAGSALLAILFGCGGGGGPNVVHVSKVTVPSKGGGCQMPILQKEADLTRPSEKLCIITSEPAKTVEDTYEVLRKQACKCGADAVVITDIKAEGKKAVVTAAAVRYVNVTGPAEPKQ